MPYRIMNKEEKQSRTILIAGAPNAGKTYLCGGSANIPGEAVVYADIDKGSATLTSSGSKIRETGSLIDLNTPRDLLELLRDIKHGKVKATMLVLDSVSRLQQFGLVSILDDAPVKAKEGSIRANQGQRDNAEVGDWGVLLVQMLRVLLESFETKLFIVMTAQVHKEKDPNDGLEKWYPQLWGKLAEMLPGYCDVIGYLAVERRNGAVLHRLHFAPDVAYLSRDRTGLLPDYIDIPKEGGWALIDKYLKMGR